jgi:hypothetical protein
MSFMIAKRHIFHIAGFDPLSVHALHRRFCRELAIFARTWGLEAKAGEIERYDGPCWTVTARGPNWAVTSVFEPLDWHDIVLGDINQSLPTLLRGGLAAGVDFVTSGTAARYFTSSLSYTFFFFGPYLIVLLLAAISLGIGVAAIDVLGAQPLLVALSTAISFAAFLLLIKSVGKWLRVQQGFADWMFSSGYVYGQRRDIAERVEAFAARIAACAREVEVEEIVLIGHSMGAILLIDAIVRVLDRHPDIGRNDVKLMVLTVGSTIPKLSLHPAGGRIRSCADQLAAQTAIDWAEYQSRGDPISFYKFHPVALQPVGPSNESGKPHIRRVQMREMLSRGTLRRRRLNYMQMHYQFVMANELRASYDYFMFVCGPVPAADLVGTPGGPADYFSVDGSLRHANPVPAVS